MIEVGNIIKNLIPTEAVVVNKIQRGSIINTS